MSLSTNTTYRVFLEKLGGSDPSAFVGDKGELFYDPYSTTLKFSDGTTAGGKTATGGIPQNSQTSAYTLVEGDVGKHVSITTGGVTVPAGVFSAGDAVSIVNNSSSNQTITQGSNVTLRSAGTTDTGNRTLANYGVCTVLCVVGGASPTFFISGAGLS